MIGGGEEDEKYHVDYELQYGTAGCPDLPHGEEGGGPAGGTEDYLQKLYEKYVPQATREYLDDRIAREENARPFRPNWQRNGASQTAE